MMWRSEVCSARVTSLLLLLLLLMTSPQIRPNKYIIYMAAIDGRVIFLPSPSSHSVWILIFLDADTRSQMMNINPQRLAITTWLPLAANINSIWHDAGDQDQDTGEQDAGDQDTD